MLRFSMRPRSRSITEDNSIAFPAADPLPNDDIPTPYFILGDDALTISGDIADMDEENANLQITPC